MAYPRCLCNSQDYHVVLSGLVDGNIVKVIKCGNCSLKRTWPMPVEENDANEFYELQEDHKERIGNIELGRKFGQKALDLIAGYKDTGKLLDVVCSAGIFVDQCRSRGYDAYGCDLSKDAIEAGKSKFGLDGALMVGSLESIGMQPESYDIITCQHVAEHMHSPDSDFSKIYNLLKPGGILLVESPNYRNIWRILFGTRWYGLVPDQHIWQYESDTLAKILKDQKFGIIRVFTRRCLHHELGPSPKGILNGVLMAIAKIFGLGDNLIIIAVKNG